MSRAFVNEDAGGPERRFNLPARTDPGYDAAAAWALIDYLTRPEQMIERRPPEQRAEHARRPDPDARAARAGPAERDRRAVPQAQRHRGIEELREMLEDVACGLDLLVLQPRLPKVDRRAGCCAPLGREKQRRLALTTARPRQEACPRRDG